mgnify:CR=1 FL=1
MEGVSEIAVKHADKMLSIVDPERQIKRSSISLDEYDLGIETTI